jgi:hypothetical protein
MSSMLRGGSELLVQSLFPEAPVLAKLDTL